MKKMKFASKALACVLSLSMVTGIVSALDWDLTLGSIEINASKDSSGNTVQTVTQYQDSGNKVENDSNPVITSGSTVTANNITITTQGGAVANATLKNVNINMDMYESDNPIEANNADVTLNLEGSNTASNNGYNNEVGVHTGSDGNMTITSSSNGSLDAFGSHGAGIGSDQNEQLNGSITITGSANVTGTSYYGAGIGSGYCAGVTEQGHITVDKDATAVGKSDTCVGIGGSHMDGTITVSGNATGASHFKNGIGNDTGGKGQIQILGNANVQSKVAASASQGLTVTDENSMIGSSKEKHPVANKPTAGRTDFILSTGSTINGQNVTDAATPPDSVNYVVDKDGNPLYVQVVDPSFVPKTEPDPKPVVPETNPQVNPAPAVKEEEKNHGDNGFWVTSKHNAIPFEKSQDGDTLTVTVDYADAEFCSNGCGMNLLLSRGIQTVIFKTPECTSTIRVASAAEAMDAWTALVLTCRGGDAKLTLDDVAAPEHLG